MKNRRLIYGWLGLVLVVFVAFYCIRPGESVSLFNYCRIKHDMTVEEVSAILNAGGDGPHWRSGTPIRVPNQGYIEGWQGNAGTIIVVYDRNGRVVECDWQWDQYRRSPLGGWLDNLLGVEQIRDG